MAAQSDSVRVRTLRLNGGSPRDAEIHLYTPIEYVTHPREGRLSHDDLTGGRDRSIETGGTAIDGYNLNPAQLATRGRPAESAPPRLSAQWRVDSKGRLFCSWQVEGRTAASTEPHASEVVVRSIASRVAGTRLTLRRTLMALAACLAIAVFGVDVSAFVGPPHDPAMAAALAIGG